LAVTLLDDGDRFASNRRVEQVVSAATPRAG
jgi:hypothetical protein